MRTRARTIGWLAAYMVNNLAGQHWDGYACVCVDGKLQSSSSRQTIERHISN